MQFRIRRQGDSTDDSSLSAEFSNNNTTSSNNHTNNSHSSSSSSSSNHFDGGLGGRVQGGEWQVEIANVATDPRDISRSTGVAAYSEFASLNSTNTANSNSNTNDAVNLEETEEFPALPSDNRPGGAGLNKNIACR